MRNSTSFNEDDLTERAFAPRKLGHTVHASLTEEEEAEAILQIHLLQKKYSLDCSRKKAITQTAKRRTDSNDNTLKDYKRQWAELYRFSIKIKDYVTAALMSEEHRAFNPLPADPETICLYWKWKCTPKGTAVLDRFGNHVKWQETFGENEPMVVMMGIGVWKAPTCIEKSIAALKLIHNEHEFLNGPYQGRCARCEELNMEKDSRGRLVPIDFSKGFQNLCACADHVNAALLKPRGNPLEYIDVKKEYECLHLTLLKTHEKKGNFQLTPRQVRMLREVLLTSRGGTLGAMKSKQLYVMILLGIKLFLRGSEVCGIMLKDFPKDHFAVSTDAAAESVQFLTVQVMGKDSNKYTTLRLYKDDDHREFCPVRHLLAYIHSAGIGGLSNGYLFPDWKELVEHLKARHDGCHNMKRSFEKPVQYADFLKRLKNCIKQVLGTEFNPNRMTVGTHTLRKTGFLFAIFGIQTKYISTGMRPFSQTTRSIDPIEDIALLKSARHKPKTDTSAYHIDALTLYADLQRQPTLLALNQVSSWEPIWVEDLDCRRNIDESTSTDMNVLEVAKFFVEKELNINVINSTFNGILERALAKKIPMSVEEEFAQLTVSLTPFEAKRLWEMFQEKPVTVLHVPVPANMDIDDDGISDNEGDDGNNCNKRKKTRKGKVFGSVSYQKHRDELDCKVATLKKQVEHENVGQEEVYELVVKFAQLKTPSGKTPDAVDCKSASWVRRLKSVSESWKKCIQDCYDGNVDGFWAVKKPLGCSQYTCNRCKLNSLKKKGR